MKKIIIIVCIVVFSGLSFSQEETLLSGKIENGGYGAPVVKFSRVKNNFALFVGGYGGWLINHTFLIGGGGYGLVNKIKGEQSAQYIYGYWDDVKIQFGYGGLYLEYIGNSNELIHYSISTLIGAGGVSYGVYNSNLYYLNTDWTRNNSSVFVLEPGINAELNVAKFFRINIGASYRFVNGVDLVGLTNSDLSGPSAGIAFKFGLF